MPQILVLPRNLLGEDKIIGDVHGHGDLFKLLVENKLAPQDRGFVVGDLFDRGQAPLTVFQLLQDHPNIYVARGNHEDIVLDACRPGATRKDIAFCLRNGGQWILQDSPEATEIKNHLEKYRQSPFELDEKYLQQLFERAPKIDQLNDILRYIENLPYIIQVGQPTEYGFLVCHADMPFSDQYLQQLIACPQNLTPAQIDHITWARLRYRDAEEKDEPFFAEGQRFDLSMLVYCGHNIIFNEATCIRRDTNHINIDSGAHLHDCFVLVNHTAGKAEVVCLDQKSSESAKFASNKEKYRRVARQISMHLKEKIILPQQRDLISTHICSIQGNIEDLKSCNITKTGRLPFKYFVMIKTLFDNMLACIQWIEELETHVSQLERAIDECRAALDRIMFESGSCCSSFWQSKVKVLDDPTATILNQIGDSLSEIRASVHQVKTRQVEDQNLYQQATNNRRSITPTV